MPLGITWRPVSQATSAWRQLGQGLCMGGQCGALEQTSSTTCPRRSLPAELSQRYSDRTPAHEPKALHFSNRGARTSPPDHLLVSAVTHKESGFALDEFRSGSLGAIQGKTPPPSMQQVHGRRAGGRVAVQRLGPPARIKTPLAMQGAGSILVRELRSHVLRSMAQNCLKFLKSTHPVFYLGSPEVLHPRESGQDPQVINKE